MKLMFDQNISYRISKKLQDHFPNCVHVSDCGLSNCDDLEIWKYAKENNYTIVTFDSDFYDISLINSPSPKIIWLRTGNLTTSEIAKLFIDNKNKISSFANNLENTEIACLELEF